MKEKELFDLVKQTVIATMNNSKPMAGIYGTLVSVSPLTFRFQGLVHELTKEFLVFPYGTTFTEKQIGNKYLFLKDKGGQRYFFQYRVGEDA